MIVRVLEVQPGRLDRGLVGLDRRGGCRRTGAQALVLVAREQASLEQRVRAALLRLRILQRRGVAREDGLRLLQRRLEGTRVEREQRIALPDLPAFDEVYGASTGP